MMIEITVDGRNFGKKGAGFTARLQHGAVIHTRSFYCNKLTTNQTELKAIEFALKSITEGYEKEPVLIKTSGRYAPMMLEKSEDGWKKMPKSNIELLGIVREQYDRFEDISIMTVSDVSELREINIDTVKNQEAFNEVQGQ
jgi:ribonuclease HI